MEAENLQVSLALLTSADLQAGEQVLSHLGDQSELHRGGGEGGQVINKEQRTCSHWRMWWSMSSFQMEPFLSTQPW